MNLLIIAAALLGGAVICIHGLTAIAGTGDSKSSSGGTERPERVAQAHGEQALGGGMWRGITLVLSSPYLLGISLFIWLYATLSTFLYFEQAHIVRDAFQDSAQRTALFSSINLAVNVCTIVLQVFIVGRLMRRVGVPATLALLPVIVAIGFTVLALAPVLAVLVAFQIVRRAGNYGVTRPVREVLFTVVGRETKYKAKNFIDTVVYRGSDAVAGWIFVGLKSLGLGLSGVAFVAVPVALAWVATGWLLGKKQETLRSATEKRTFTEHGPEVS